MTETFNFVFQNSSVHTNKSSNFDGRVFEFGWNIRIPLIILSFVVILWDIFALFAINTARKTPKIVKFLSTALITFEIFSLIAFSVRKFLLNPAYNDTAMVIGSQFVLLSFLTIGIMSSERLVLFSSNKIYLPYVRFKTFKRISVTSWVFISFLYYLSRYFICKLTDFKLCTHNMKVAFGILVFVVVVVSLCCYIRIFVLLRYETSLTTCGRVPKRSIRKLRSTCLMFAYLVVTLAGFMLFVVDIIFEPSQKIKTLQFDVFVMVSCAVDPLLHVWWFRECRILLLSIPAVYVPALKKRVERMKIELFEIVTYKSTITVSKLWCNCKLSFVYQLLWKQNLHPAVAKIKVTKVTDEEYRWNTWF